MKPKALAPPPPSPLHVEPTPSAGWEEWHHKQHVGPPQTEPAIPQAYIPGLGTVRECIDCGCLIAGGPTRCKRCVKEMQKERRRTTTR